MVLGMKGRAGGAEKPQLLLLRHLARHSLVSLLFMLQSITILRECFLISSPVASVLDERALLMPSHNNQEPLPRCCEHVCLRIVFRAGYHVTACESFTHHIHITGNTYMVVRLACN